MISGLTTVAVIAGLVALCWVISLSAAIAWSRRRWGQPKPQQRQRAPGRPKWLVRGAELVTAVSAAAVGYALWVEPYWPEVTRHEVPVSQLRRGQPSIRIVHLSDLHSDPTTRLEDRIPVEVAALEPDLIVFTGDAINSEAGLPNFRRCLAALAAVAPTFAVLGNWEQWWFPNVDLYLGTKVQLLKERSVRLMVRGTPVIVAGVSVDYDRQIPEVLDRHPPAEGGIVIFLHHFPETVAEAAKHSVALQLSGDTHGGGQLRLLLLGEMVRVSRQGGYFDSGLHRVGRSWLYVNRGIGMEGGNVPRFRLGCRPEIALLELVAQ